MFLLKKKNLKWKYNLNESQMWWEFRQNEQLIISQNLRASNFKFRDHRACLILTQSLVFDFLPLN